MMPIVAYADGGCSPNPGPGGWGVVVLEPKGLTEFHGGDSNTTNNRMELTAAIRALEYLPEGTFIHLRCDSRYVVDSITKWIPEWKAKGWRSSKGEVMNLDLMQRLDELASQRDVRALWIPGHAGDEFNERADRLAARGRREASGHPAKTRGSM